MENMTYAERMDTLHEAVRSVLDAWGYTAHGPTYNRLTEDYLTQVVDIQVYPRDLPYAGWHLYEARFTINLGVFVPEIADCFMGPRQRSHVEENECAVRTRLGRASGSPSDLWWPIRYEKHDLDDVVQRLRTGGMAFLEQFSTRDKIMEQLYSAKYLTESPEITGGIILAQRGRLEEARKLFAKYVDEIKLPEHQAHKEYIRDVIKRAGVWRLDASG